MKRIIAQVFAGMIAGILIFSSCEKVVFPEVEIILPDTVSYSLEIQPIWEAKCKDCHWGDWDPDLRPDVSYLSLFANDLIDTVNAEESKLIKKLYGSHDDRATETEKQLILEWIKKGARNN
jgi:hypothetical protein